MMRTPTNTLLRFLLLIIAFMTIGLPASSSQAIYEVRNTLVGDIHINGTWNDSSFTAISHECIVRLDYETGEFNAELDIASLVSGINTMDSILRATEEPILRYHGYLGVELIRTTSHPKEEFSVEGYLNCAPHNDRIIGNGIIEHIFGDVYSCILNISFQIDLSELYSSEDLGLFGSEVNVEILQAILKRNDE